MPDSRWDGVEDTLRSVLDDLLPEAGEEAIAECAAVIARGVQTLPVTTKVTPRERRLSSSAAEILRAGLSHPEPAGSAG
jgi:hypothetical protein